MKKYKNKIILSAVIIAVLTAVFWWGGDAPGLRGSVIEEKSKISDASERRSVEKSREESENTEAENTDPEEALPSAANDDTEAYESGDNASVSNENKIEFETAAVPFNEAKNEQSVQEAASASAEDTPELIEEDENTCTISVKCDKILDNMEYMDKNKYELIPEDGCILPETKAVFNEGENVFNVLQRELKRAKIHLEFTSTPVFDNVYIEGINNIYEFDCGENSGWMYSVNGEFPNFGCSKYIIKKGDIIEWTYTCDLGRDVGGYYAGKGTDK